MTIELTADELLAQAKAEYEAKAAAIRETAARHRAEIAQRAAMLESEQRRIEREVEKRATQDDIDVYVLAWREKFTEQSDVAAAWVEKMTQYIEILKRAGSRQQFIQNQVQVALTEFASGFKAYRQAFDSEAEMRQALYSMAEQLTVGISWNLPASGALRMEMGIHNSGWQTTMGDLRKRAIDRGLKAAQIGSTSTVTEQPSALEISATTHTKVLEVSAQTHVRNADGSVTVHNEFVDLDAPTAPSQPTPQRRQKRK